MQTLMCDAVDPKGTTVREDAFLFQAQNTKAHLIIACVLPPEKLRVPREAFLSNVEGEKASSFIPTRTRSSYGFSDKELKLALCVSLFKNGNSRTRGRIFLSEVILRGQFCHEEFQELDFFNPMKVFIETVLEENEALRGRYRARKKASWNTSSGSAVADATTQLFNYVMSGYAMKHRIPVISRKDDDEQTFYGVRRCQAEFTAPLRNGRSLINIINIVTSLAREDSFFTIEDLHALGIECEAV